MLRNTISLSICNSALWDSGAALISATCPAPQHPRTLMVASTYRRDPRSSIRAGTEANTTALLLPACLICSVPTDHAGAAGCTTAPVSPDGWVYFQIIFHERYNTNKSTTVTETQYATNRIKKVLICLPANRIQYTPKPSLTFSYTQTSLGHRDKRSVFNLHFKVN